MVTLLWNCTPLCVASSTAADSFQAFHDYGDIGQEMPTERHVGEPYVVIMLKSSVSRLVPANADETAYDAEAIYSTFGSGDSVSMAS
ncbi:hypothetical protein LTR16_002902, partial [Cryomyces antarcticus]